MFESFKRELLSASNIQSKHIPYYVQWVRECYDFLGLEPNTRLPPEQKQSFLMHLQQQCEDWQVKQVERALL